MAGFTHGAGFTHVSGFTLGRLLHMIGGLCTRSTGFTHAWWVLYMGQELHMQGRFYTQGQILTLFFELMDA